MIAVIDYKAGNLTSVVKALRHLGADVTVTDSPVEVKDAAKVVLPGVGHFSATRLLDETGLTDAVREVIVRGVPFLGICVGMQWLLAGSEEAPDQPGLGHFQPQCERFPSGGEKVPHVGWNDILVGNSRSQLLSGVEGGEFVYYTHSYFVPPNTVYENRGESTNPVAAVSHYIKTFAAVVEHENVMGVQFHPEKSGATGLKVLKNFLEFSC